MKVLESIKIKDIAKKFDRIWTGCDYLRLSYKDKSDLVEYYIENLDTDNSNFATDTICWIDFTVQKWYCLIWTTLTYSCSYNDISVPCFQFVKFDEKTSYHFKGYWKLDFYWSFFRLLDIWFFDKSIFIKIKNLFSEDNPKVTRFDYRIDFFSYSEKKVPSAVDILWYIHTQSNCIDYKKWTVITDWICWSKKNWRYAIRYYDKLEDTNKKTKVFLYQDYYKFKSVHRLEFEFQRNFLRGFTFYDFFDWLIENKIEGVLRINDKLFKWTMFYEYEEDFRITDKNRVPYLKRYSTMTKRLAKNGINPLIECYRTIFYELEEEELLNNLNDFLDFVWSDKRSFKMLYEYKKQEFLNLHKI